jgi:hypothetical protein
LNEQEVQDEIQPEPVEDRGRWNILPWTGDKLSHEAKLTALRLNSLGDPYFFGKAVLGYDRFVRHLHGRWLDRLSDPELKLVFQAPRDHFKSTCGTVTLSIWWALPFGNREEDWMYRLGYSEAWVRYMRRIHDPNVRIAIASETEPNAIMMGFRFDAIYESNKVFRDVFSDILPQTGSTWNQLLKTQNRTKGDGEGTFNFMGVGTVLQSRHFDRSIQDDLFGEEALYSESTRDRTIEWHQRLPGAFDTDRLSARLMNLELVIGNRWGLNDLNGHIMENDTSFSFETHSAEGGCCPHHPPGQPIFPEEFTMDRLASLRVRFGIRSYSAHYLNMPISEEECAFRKQWIPRFLLKVKEMGNSNDGTPIKKTVIERLGKKEGEVYDDILVSELKRMIVLDPNHGGEKGRARHAAVCVGLRRRADGKKELYLLEAWAKACSHDQMIGEVGNMATRWHADTLHIETIAGQDGWLYFFERDMREKLPRMYVVSLPKERGSGAKERRITSMSPMYERGQVWVKNTGGGSEEFMREYELHPNGKTVDLIDCMGYLFNIVEGAEVDVKAWQHRSEMDQERRRRSVGRAGY